MPPESQSLHLSFEEVEKVAVDVRRVWRGCTGQPGSPTPEQITDLVQVVMRKAREVIAQRLEAA